MTSTNPFKQDITQFLSDAVSISKLAESDVHFYYADPSVTLRSISRNISKEDFALIDQFYDDFSSLDFEKSMKLLKILYRFNFRQRDDFAMLTIVKFGLLEYSNPFFNIDNLLNLTREIDEFGKYVRKPDFNALEICFVYGFIMTAKWMSYQNDDIHKLRVPCLKLSIVNQQIEMFWFVINSGFREEERMNAIRYSFRVACEHNNALICNEIGLEGILSQQEYTQAFKIACLEDSIDVLFCLNRLRGFDGLIEMSESNRDEVIEELFQYGCLNILKYYHSQRPFTYQEIKNRLSTNVKIYKYHGLIAWMFSLINLEYVPDALHKSSLAENLILFQWILQTFVIDKLELENELTVQSTNLNVNFLKLLLNEYGQNNGYKFGKDVIWRVFMNLCWVREFEDNFRIIVQNKKITTEVLRQGFWLTFREGTANEQKTLMIVQTKKLDRSTILTAFNMKINAELVSAMIETGKVDVETLEEKFVKSCDDNEYDVARVILQTQAISREIIRQQLERERILKSSFVGILEQYLGISLI